MVGVGGAVAVLVGWRVAVSGVQGYGSDGAQYIEHVERLKVLAMLRGGGSLDPLRLLVEADGSFPPLLHLGTVAAGALVGHGIGAATALSIGWLLLLGGAVGAACRTLGGRGDVALAAVLLMPAMHGAAARYYYDLPMTAVLWVAVALALGAAGRPGRAGLVGVAAAGASLLKWAAIPFGAPMVLGAMLGRSASWRQRAVGLGVASAVSGGLLLGFLGAAGPDTSFSTHAQATWGDGPPSWVEPGGPGPVDLVLGRLGERVIDAGWQGLAFYPLRLVTSVLSPGGVLALLALLWAGRRGLRPLLPLATVTVLGHAFVLLVVVPVWDDRFLLPAAPLLAVAAGLAFPWVRGPRWGPVLLAIGGLIALDFHVGVEGPHNRPTVLLQDEGEHLPRTFARGLFAAASEERRGWSRRDEDRPERAAFRDALWAGILRCGARVPAVLSERPLVDPDGDHAWLQLRALEEELLRAGPRVEPEALCVPEARIGDAQREGRLDLLVTGRGSGLALPDCVEPALWQPAGGVDDPEGGPGAVLWRPRGEPPCPEG